MVNAYVPDQGDVVWLNFTPQAGHEQAGHRPALVLTPKGYNQRTGLMVCCPITTQVKGYPFEVPIEGNPAVNGAVLSDQLKSLDWKTRRAAFKGRIESAILREVLGKAAALLSLKKD